MDPPESPRQPPRYYEFDGFCVEVPSRVIMVDGTQLAVSPKAVEALVLLIASRPALVEKTALIRALWPESFVEENNLAQCISGLRRALGDHREHPRYIATVSGRGYRFLREQVVERFDERVPTAHQPASSPEAPVAVIPSERRRIFTPRTLGGLLGVLFLSVTALTAYRWRQAPEPPPHRAPVVIVEVFQAPTQDDYLGRGMAEALIAKLSRMPGIIVRPHAIREEPGGTLEVRRRSGADAVVSGTVERNGDRVRLAVQLTAVGGGAPLWSASFELPWADILSVQETVAERLAVALVGGLSSEQRRVLAQRQTTNPQAYERYLRSRYFWNQRNADAFLKAIEQAKAALDADGSYALAYVALADAYALLGSLPNTVMPRREAMSQAREAAEKALALDETVAEAHTSLAFVKMHYDWDWTSAERGFRRAIQLRPEYSTAHHWYAIFLTSQQRFDEAFSEIARARELDPLSLIIATDVAEISMLARQPAAAREQALRALELDPGFATAHYVLASTYLLDQPPDHASAMKHFTRAKDLGWAWAESHLAYTSALSGDRINAAALLRDLEARSRTRFGMNVELAYVHGALGDSTSAIRELEEAYQERSGSLVLMNVDPRLASLRTDPRFLDLRRRVHGR